MNDFNLNLEFDLEKNKSNVIKVIGVGGGGGNAVNYMYHKGIKDVDFVVVNTDAQDLSKSPVPIKIQIGKELTEGLGAGANPEIGERAANEDIKAIKSILENNTKMIFITAGMGGGTGTGAAPIIAKLAKEMGILTVAIVTSPFEHEGKKRNLYAQKGIENLRDFVDSLIIINNNKLREIYGNLAISKAFAKSDEILASAASSIAEVITHNYMVNVDFRDVKTVLEDSGTAIMGSAVASGENRAQEVIMQALDSPLLNDNKITGAKNVLVLVVSGKNEITIDEMSDINDYIQTEAGNNADIIMGIGEDESLGEGISVTVIATGFDENQQDTISNAEPDKIVHVLEEEISTQLDDTEVANNFQLEEEENEAPATDTPRIIAEIDPFGNTQMAMNFGDLEMEEEKTEDFQEETPDVFEDIRLIKKDAPEETKEPETEVEAKEEIKEEIKAEEKNNVQQPMLFNLNEEKKEEINIEEVEDLTELPVEIALKLSKKRKNYIKKYINGLAREEEIPAFKKKGIEVDLTPKSSADVHKIELDENGEFKLKDRNSFLDDNVD